MIDVCPNCIAPSHDQMLWRYLDLSKYISLISSGKLFLSRVGVLEDKYEGRYTHLLFPSKDGLAEIIRSAREKWPSSILQRQSDEKLQAIATADREASLATVNLLRNFAHVSCWHRSDYESAAMWRTYLKSNEGVAIRTTYGHLQESLKGGPPGTLLLCGNVNYLDYNSARIASNEFFLPFMSKRLSFDFEKEFRILAVEMDAISQVAGNAEAIAKAAAGEGVKLQAGVQVDFDVAKLIQAIFIAPTAPPWFRAVVTEINTKYGITVSVDQSDLAKDPVQ